MQYSLRKLNSVAEFERLLGSNAESTAAYTDDEVGVVSLLEEVDVEAFFG
jgi:hypothetical protein